MALQKKAEEKRNTDDENLVIRNCRIWTGSSIRDASILIVKGKIRKIGNRLPASSGDQIDAKGLLALPGLVDAHVHLRDMELSYEEDFESGTSAAAAGGFTSILDMPNTKPPVDSVARLRERKNVASKKILVNVGFHAALVGDSHTVAGMTALGAFSLKLYMPRPISALNVENDGELRRVLKTASANKIPVTVHAEEPSMLGDDSDARTYLDLARKRPAESESHAVMRMLALQRVVGCSMHFAHITLPSSLRLIRSQHSSRATSEVTPHHLLLSESRIGKLGWKAWMVPPLRRQTISWELLSAASRGLATIVASDHAPHSISEKKRLRKSPPGIPGLETTLPLLLTLVNKGRISLKRMVTMLALNPSRLFGLPSKGRLAVGADGDIVLVDLRKRSKVNPESFQSKAKYSPFEGYETQGGVEKTIVGGKLVFDEGHIIASPGTGSVLRRAR